MTQTMIFDVDGTLVDSNYQHALAWYRAFRGVGITLPIWRIHRHIGMGGDQLVGALAGDSVEEEHGDRLREAWAQEFQPMLAETAALPEAVELLRVVRDRGLRLVLASSGKPEHVEHYLDLLEAREVAQAWTTSEDVENTKPAPDLVKVALDKVGGGPAVMVGDATWDFVPLQELGIPGVAVRTGGFADEELRDAGAAEVYDSLADLRADLDRWAPEPR